MILTLGYRNNGTLCLHTSWERIIIAEEEVVVMSSEERGSDQQSQSGSQFEAGERRKKSVEHSI